MLAVVHRYLPSHNAGAETMLHAILRDLVDHGWECLVLSQNHRGPAYKWDGVNVERAPRDLELTDSWEWTDVAITHLHGTRGAIAWSRRGRPLVHLVHNHAQLRHQRVTARDAALVVWNSEWVRKAWEEWSGPSIVTRPPVLAERYRTENDDRFTDGAVTLLNLCEAKGGKTFWRLAGERPDLTFLGVEGAYHIQEPAPDLPNVIVEENTPDVLHVYERTRVLVVPSRYESWGQVAVEAMASGIPVIAANTPGLREACTSPEVGECALFCDPDNVTEWLDALEMLDDPRAYGTWSDASLRRSAELDEQAAFDMKALRETLHALAEGRSIA